MDEMILIHFSIEPKTKMHGTIEVPKNLIEGETVVKTWENVKDYIGANLDDADLTLVDDDYDYSNAKITLDNLICAL